MSTQKNFGGGRPVQPAVSPEVLAELEELCKIEKKNAAQRARIKLLEGEVKTGILTDHSRAKVAAKRAEKEDARKVAQEKRAGGFALAQELMSSDERKAQLVELVQYLQRRYVRISEGKPSAWVRVTAEDGTHPCTNEELMRDIRVSSRQAFSPAKEHYGTKDFGDIQEALKGLQTVWMDKTLLELEEVYRVGSCVERPFARPGVQRMGGGTVYNAFPFHLLPTPKPYGEEGKLLRQMLVDQLGEDQTNRLLDIMAVLISSLGRPGRQLQPLLIIGGEKIGNANSGKSVTLEIIRGIFGAGMDDSLGLSASADSVLKGKQFIGSVYTRPLWVVDDPTDVAKQERLALIFKQYASVKSFEAEHKGREGSTAGNTTRWCGLLAVALNWDQAVKVLQAGETLNGTANKRVCLVAHTPPDLYSRPEYMKRRDNMGDLMEWVYSAAPELLWHVIETRFKNQFNGDMCPTKWNWLTAPVELTRKLVFPDTVHRFAYASYEHPELVKALESQREREDKVSFISEVVPYLDAPRSVHGYTTTELLGQVSAWSSIQRMQRTETGSMVSCSREELRMLQLGKLAQRMSSQEMSDSLQKLADTGGGITRFPATGRGPGNKVYWQFDPKEFDLPDTDTAQTRNFKGVG